MQIFTIMLNTGKLAGKTLYITGASRGIGLEFAKKAARDGANVVIAAKTAEPHPKLPGTIFTAAKEIEDLGGKALPVVVDVRCNQSNLDFSYRQWVSMSGQRRPSRTQWSSRSSSLEV